MNTIPKLIRPCSVGYKLIVNKEINKAVTLSIPVFNARTMAQKTITSFFKLSPPKPAELYFEDSQTASSRSASTSSSSESEPDYKHTAKRQRSDSSDSDTFTPNKSAASKKNKRQRIDSSSSDSQSPKKPNNVATESPEKINKTESPDPNKSAEDIEIKVEDDIKNIDVKNIKVKTYASPKSKKAKAQEVVKERKSKSPESKKSMKSFLVNVKKEPVEEIEKPKPEAKKTKEFFTVIKKESKDKDNGAEESTLVPEEEYNPGKSNYHPVKDACWRKGQAVPYLALARTLEVIEATAARLKMIEILSNYFRSVIALTPEDLLPSLYLCLNQLAPAYHSLELGIAETYLMKAVGVCTGRSVAQVRAAAARAGDLGAAAQAARATQRTMFAAPHLRLRTLFQALKDIANMTGQASVNKKINKIQSLFVACRHSEAKYLIRSLEGKLRVGLAEQSALQALALAAAHTPPEKKGEELDVSQHMPADKFKALVDQHALAIKTAYCECPDYGRVVAALLEGGVALLPRRCVLAPGVPLKPMLAHPTRGVHDIFTRFEGCEFTCEWKYDGERAQLHVPRAPGDNPAPDLARAAVFSRNQEDNTSKYPDIIARLPALLKEGVHSCVLDCEAVAYDKENKQILPFQVLSTRKRKAAAAAEVRVQVCVFVFDVLFLNGEPLVQQPLQRRRELLRTHFNEVEGEWQLARSKDCSSVEQVAGFLEDAVRNSCEGLMVKTLSGPHARYDIARRSRNWLKLKKDYLEGVGDTIDAVVVGAYAGRGKRAGVFGGFLLACYDPHTEQYQALCKIGTGFSDHDLATLAEALKPHIIDSPPSYYRYDKSHEADTWVSARVVLEVRCADLSLSPAHLAARGTVDPHKGISLRFPRMVRIRDDKTPEQATSAQQIADMYLAQDQVKNTHKPALDHDDFY